ncbi:MAG: glutamine--tRNA ligase/YqeY domain fusion protein [Deltaproteobacteria bacterium]|nr:glutamine--tRNA ligase/YqeY domain fusion protein [Deltaproteobacteria bacterium]
MMRITNICYSQDDGSSPSAANNFIREIIDGDIESGINGGRVATRFPPEPNGYLHIGHAKSIVLNYGLARDYGGTFNVRFDDTNPITEDEEYVDSILEDIKWLGAEFDGRVFYASDYFDQFYIWAVELITKGLAYVDDLSPEQLKEMRGDYNRPGVDSPSRSNTVERNLELFQQMKDGKFGDGERLLRAKIDMKSPNMNLRDPIIYRVLHRHHYRLGDKWCIYPMYDFAHGFEDSIEGITHSICTLEFENHRPLYDWFLDNVTTENRPHQYEFARLNLNYTVMSKRRLLELVERKLVKGWNDPRLPTISGLRRRGYTSESIWNFCERIGVAKRNSTVDIGLLEHSIRTDLNESAPRVMGVLEPLKVVITNFPDNEVIWFDAPLHPEKHEMGTRKVPLTKEIFIEKEDFREDAPRKFFRLKPGGEIRLRYACLIKCEKVIKGPDGNIEYLECTWDPESKGGTSPDGRKVRGTSHWVSASHGQRVEIRLYDRLFTVENPMDTDGSYLDFLNPDSLVVLKNSVVEPYLGSAVKGSRWQFERKGYFYVDPFDSADGNPVFNRTVTLKDSWARIDAAKTKMPEKSVVNKVPELKTEKRDEAVSEISFDDFSKVALKCARVVKAEAVENADKLVRFELDLGEGRLRQIFSGIKKSYPDPSILEGKSVVVVSNLKPRKMKFGLSEGMVLATEIGSEIKVMLAPEGAFPGADVN